ncbi:MAG TPA: substrate-binding domain-containing protein [Allosphingosinicella sp.]
MKKSILSIAVATLALAACGQNEGSQGGEGGARNQIRIVGSSTVYPFAKAVAERFAQLNPQFKAPILESTGTGAGMKLFCAGVGAQHPDITNASRRIKASEFEDCQKNGVKDIVEVQVGIDGLALIEANSAQPIKLTLEDVYKALAANPYGKPNTAKTWRDVNPALPAVAIQVYGPPPTSGTRDALAEMILEKGCDQNAEMKALKKTDEDKHKDICTKVREDGAYVEAGENDNLLVQKVAANPGSIGIMGYSFLEENTDKVRGIALNGVEPTTATISSFQYPGARPLFIYVKAQHVNAIPGIKEYLAEFVKAWGQGGYLAQHGLIPSPADVQAKAAAAATALTPLQASELK